MSNLLSVAIITKNKDKFIKDVIQFLQFAVCRWNISFW